MVRINRDEYFLRIAEVVAMRATCHRRSVGCVLVNSRNHVMATGMNGVPSGIVHCNEHNHQCAGAHAPTGTSLDLCIAVHAEMNAIAQCGDVHSIDTCYTTASPCIHCLKVLMNTSCKRIVFLEEYPHPTAKFLWAQVGRNWEHYPKSW
jgi:dCMP deaminase